MILNIKKFFLLTKYFKSNHIYFGKQDEELDRLDFAGYVENYIKPIEYPRFKQPRKFFQIIRMPPRI
jgi:hypothetical protein